MFYQIFKDGYDTERYFPWSLHFHCVLCKVALVPVAPWWSSPNTAQPVCINRGTCGRWLAWICHFWQKHNGSVKAIFPTNESFAKWHAVSFRMKLRRQWVYREVYCQSRVNPEAPWVIQFMWKSWQDANAIRHKKCGIHRINYRRDYSMHPKWNDACPTADLTT